jgi:uncharacterized ubiquitin-like protein YukD
MKKSILLSLLFLFILVFATSFKIHSQSSKEKTFIVLLEELSKQDALKDYKDRSALSGDFKNKLIISDLKENPILNKQVEENDFIVASYAKTVGSEPRFYVLPRKVIITRDSSYIEFDVINKYQLKLSGKFRLFNDDSKHTNSGIAPGAHSEFVFYKEN